MQTESILEASPEVALDFLNFKTPGVSSSVLQKQVSRFYPSGNSFGPNGVKQLKINLQGEGWILPWTMSLRFQVTSKSGTGNTQTLLMPCFGAFKSLQVHTGQVLAERLDSYNRLYSLIRETLAPTDTQNELYISSGKKGDTIEPNESVMYQMGIMCGLAGASVAWPLHKCPITLDFGIVDSSAQWLSGNSSSFEISQVCVEVTQIMVDPSIDDAITRKPLSGGNLNIPITSFFVSSAMVDHANTSISTARALSRLKKVFLNFKGNSDDASVLRYPGASFKMGIRIDGERIPVNDVEDNVDAHLHLKSCLGHDRDGRMSLNITPAQWKSTKYTLGFGFEKDENFGSGKSLKMGGLMTTMMTGVDTAVVNELFTIMEHDLVISIGDQATCQVFD